MACALWQAVKETGRRFRDTVLGLGGGRAPLEVRTQPECRTIMAANPVQMCHSVGFSPPMFLCVLP